MSNIVAIVGRPNVGKSTLFNRFIESREAIVDPTAGTTRDRHYGKAEWNGRHFSVIDTGGYVTGSDDIFEGEIRKQVNLAIEEPIDPLPGGRVQHGITGMDEAIAKMLRKAKKPVMLVANKVDTSDKPCMPLRVLPALGSARCTASVHSSGAGTGRSAGRSGEELHQAHGGGGADVPKHRHRGQSPTWARSSW
jgi:GTP-binding protein